jgi:hypothetical protein
VSGAGEGGHDADEADRDADGIDDFDVVAVRVQAVFAGAENIALDAHLAGLGQEFAVGQPFANLGGDNADLAGRDHDDGVADTSYRTGFRKWRPSPKTSSCTPRCPLLARIWPGGKFCRSWRLPRPFGPVRHKCGRIPTSIVHQTKAITKSAGNHG